MNDKSPVLALEQLQSLATAPPPTTAAAVRAMLGAIEAALAAGATHEQIHAALAEGGYTASLGTFRNALYRARRQALTTGDRKTKAGGMVGAPARHEPQAGLTDRQLGAGSVLPGRENPIDARKRQMAEAEAERARLAALTAPNVPPEAIPNPDEPLRLRILRKPQPEN